MRVPGVWDVDRAQAALNVFGGATFAVGSLLFLNSALVRLGIAFFVVGSFAMLAGALAVWNQRYAPGRPTADGSALTLEPAAQTVAGDRARHRHFSSSTGQSASRPTR